MTNYSETIFSIFQNATGYERDELEPELELEAELGIDTVKQAEILGQIRTEFGLPEEQEFNLADLSTIAAIITLVERHHHATGSVDETKAIEEMRTETDNAGPILVRVHGVDREEIGESIRRALKAQDQRVHWSNFQAIPVVLYAWLLSRHLKMLRHALRTLSRNHLVVLRLRYFLG